jgi:Plasma-membrane choline transporter
MARNEETDKLVAAADFDGPTEARHCTDILMLILIICMWIAMTGVGIYVSVNGDYRLVLYPMDYDGNICGTDFDLDMTDFPYLLYVNSYAGGVCVKECPDLSNKVPDNLTDIGTLITYAGIFQPFNGSLASLPADFVEVGDYSNSNNSIACTDAACFPNSSPQLSWVSEGIRESYGYAYYVADTYELLWRCYETSEAEARIEALVTVGGNGTNSLQVTDEATKFFTKLYGDLWAARKYILGFGFGVSVVISFMYIFLMRMPLVLTAMVWTSILVTIALFFIGGYYAWSLATDWDNANPKTVSSNTIHATTGASFVLYAIGGILVLLTCCLRKQIQTAISCVKQAGRAINCMTIILLVPVLQAVGLLLFMIVFGVYGVNLASLGNIIVTEIPLSLDGQQVVSVRSYEYSDFVENCGWFLLFCLFWTSNFIVALGDMIVSMSVAKWYFTKNKLTIGSWTVLNSVWQTIFYHSGTCAYGSLILAVIQLIRAMIARAQKAAKDTNNKIAGAILCCCQCCFCCLECCIKFINKNAYIQTAIFSTAFCKSCRQSFYLIFRNAARIAAITYVSSAVLIVGKLFISAVTTTMSYYFIVENISDDLNSVGGPVCVVFLISYWVSDFFMDVFDMAITTVLHCLIADEEMFDEDTGYAEHDLKRWVDKHGSADG